MTDSLPLPPRSLPLPPTGGQGYSGPDPNAGTMVPGFPGGDTINLGGQTYPVVAFANSPQSLETWGSLKPGQTFFHLPSGRLQVKGGASDVAPPSPEPAEVATPSPVQPRAPQTGSMPLPPTNLAMNDKGDVLAFDGQAWKPAPVAVNDKGDRVAFNGKDWAPEPAATAKVASTGGDLLDKINTGVNWAGTQLTKGATGLLGAARGMADTNQAVGQWAGEKLGFPETGKAVGEALRYANPLGPVGATMPTSQNLNDLIFKQGGVPEVNAADNPALTLTNPLGIPGKVNLGAMADAGVQAIPGMALGPARGAAALVPALTGGAGAEAAGQATAGTPYEVPAKLAGGVVGALAGSKAVTPLPSNLTPEQTRLVEIAKDKGIPLTVGQETGRGRGIESALARFPTSQGQMARLADEQAMGVNRAAIGEMGKPYAGERVDVPTMDRLYRQASNEFEAAKNMPQRVELPPDFYNKTTAAKQAYIENTPQSQIVTGVLKRFDDFFDPKLMKGGAFPELDGAQYQSFRKAINDAAEAASDGGVKTVLKNLRSSLDDAAEASLPADKVEAWQAARKAWANLKILDKSASGGSVESRAAGNLTPSALTGALRQAQGPDRFANTQGGMNDIARVAGYLADTRPNSGTPQTMAMQSMLTGGPMAAGYALGGLPGAAGAGAAMLAPNLLARAMTGSKGAGWLRDYLANQRMGQSPAPFGLIPGTVSALPRLSGSQ